MKPESERKIIIEKIVKNYMKILTRKRYFHAGFCTKNLMMTEQINTVFSEIIFSKSFKDIQ